MKTTSDLRDELGLGPGPIAPDQRDQLIREIARAMVETLEVDDLKANALGRLVDAEGATDVLRAHNKLTGAVVMATLSEVDAIQELTATLKGIANTLIDVIEVVSPVRSTKEEAMEQEQAPAEPDESITAEAPEEPQAEPGSTESEPTSSPDEPAAEPDAPADPEPSDPEPESEDAGGGEPATEE